MLMFSLYYLFIQSKALISPRDGGTTFKVNFPPQLNLSEKAPIDVPEVCLCWFWIPLADNEGQSSQPS